MKLAIRSALPWLALPLLSACGAAIEDGSSLDSVAGDEAVGVEQAPLIPGRYLSGFIGPAPRTLINLSANSPIDWIAMDTNPAIGNILQRKANVTAQIVEPTLPKLGGGGGALTFSWTGGTPKASATSVSNFHVIQNPGESFHFTVPAEAQGRQVIFYGTLWGTAHFHATLDGLTDDQTLSNFVPNEPYYFSYLVTFDTPTTGKKLDLTMTVDSAAGAYLDLYAAHLFKVTAPVNISLDATDTSTGRYVPVPYAGDTVVLRAGVEGNDVRGVEFFRNGTKLGEDLTYPYEFPVTLPVGRSNYTAKATNNSNQVGTSNTVTRNAWFAATNFVRQTIPDATAAGLQGPLSATTVGGKSVKQAIALVDIDHTWDSDLSLKVRSPTGVVVSLASQVGGSGDNFRQTVFRDDAATPISAGSAPFRGDYRSLQPLSALINQPLAGTWRIDIADNAASDVGTVDTRMLLLRVDD